MAVNTSSVYYKAETVPPTIKAIWKALCAAYGVGADHGGDRGNTAHTSGYHRSRRWVLHDGRSSHGSGDYSVQLAADKGGDENDVSAFDFTPGDWGTAENRRRMIEITTRVIDAAKARDPRLAHLREFAGTLDGKHVVTYDLARHAFKDPFDSSHLDHCHGSLYRSLARADHSGIIEVMLGRGSGGGDGGTDGKADGSTTDSTTEDDMQTLMKWTGSKAVFVTDGKTALLVSNEDELADRKQLHKEGTLILGNNGGVREVGNKKLIGLVIGPCPTEFADQAYPGAAKTTA